ncbi:MAG: hypothetical protein RLY20_1896 [Verrucomicrobiota bacterium]|jgi:signal transduction histidine kinase
MNLRLPVLMLLCLLAASVAGNAASDQIWQPAEHPITVESAATKSIAESVGAPPGISALTPWKLSIATRSGDAWLASEHKLAQRHRGIWREVPNPFGGEPPVSFAETIDARLWCATAKQLWQFDGRDWLALRSVPAGIRSIRATRDGSLWVATPAGLLRLTRHGWVPNDVTDGLADNDVGGVTEDADGNVFAETVKGWSQFQPEMDVDAPITTIISTNLSHAGIHEDATLTIQFIARDKHDKTAPTNLLYSWRMDEHEWTPFVMETQAIVSGLGLGPHTFYARALDRNGNAEFIPAALEFNIVIPWYRESRIMVVLALAMIVSLLLATLALNRHRHLKQSYAEVEKLVAERTRELELANRELLHSQKMNALGSLAAGIAHDFNNILSIIKGSAQIIEDNPGNTDKIRTRVDRIKAVVQQGAEVVEAMLGFSRSSDAPPALCDINAVVADTRRLLGDRFLREMEVRFERGENLPEVAVTRDFVQQILLNLIFNAADAMETKSSTGNPSTRQITLRTRTANTLPKELALAPSPAPTFVFVTVGDHGCGIKPEIMSRIFEPFFTTKALSTRRGTGLGLSMAYELAKKLGAGLAVESKPGEGSEFTLILPVKS